MVPLSSGYSQNFGLKFGDGNGRMDVMDRLNTEKAKKKKNDDDDDEEEEGGVDRISELPDEILVHVLSFLPLRTAAATSVLSLRWLHLWKHLPNLNFDDLGTYDDLFHLFSTRLFRIYNNVRQRCERSQLCMRKYIDWVNTVIELYDKSHSQSLQEFSIVVLVDKPNQRQVTKWLEFASSRRVETLKLISCEGWVKAGVLADMLKDMNILGFRSLKVLWLKSFEMSSEAIEFLLRCCPMLERLVLDRLSVTTDLEVGGSIKHLDMRCTQYYAKSVKICAPNLTWLTTDHDTRKVSFENVPKLVNMTIYCASCSLTDTKHGFAQVARQLETLVIFLLLLDPEVAYSLPKMPNLKKLVVYDRFHRHNVLLPVTYFMLAAPALEDFRIEVGELDVKRKLFIVPEDYGHVHRRLRRFMLSGFCGGCRDRIELVRYVVNYCVALEEIVIGQCNREGLMGDFVDYCVPLHHIIPSPNPGHKDYVATPQERQDINKLVRLFTPPRIKLRVV